MSFPVIGEPGKAEQVGGAPLSCDLSGRRKRALRRQMAANSKVGAGMAALWGWDSMLMEREKENKVVNFIHTTILFQNC